MYILVDFQSLEEGLELVPTTYILRPRGSSWQKQRPPPFPILRESLALGIKRVDPYCQIHPSIGCLRVDVVGLRIYRRMPQRLSRRRNLSLVSFPSLAGPRNDGDGDGDDDDVEMNVWNGTMSKWVETLKDKGKE